MKKILLILLLLPFFASAQIETYLVSPYGNIEFDSARVMTIDSGIIYVTPTMLSDSLAGVGGGTDTNALTTNTPMSTTLDTVQRNGVNSALFITTDGILINGYISANGAGGITALNGNVVAAGVGDIYTSGTGNIYTSDGDITVNGVSKHFNGAYLTPSEMLITDASKNIVSAPVATYPSLTELTYLKGVTSAIQTQINGKQSTISFGTGVQTALGINIGSAGAPVLFNGALGTPSSGTLTNATGLPQSGVTNLTTDLGLKAPLANPTFTGTVTIPTPFTLGATSVTSTGTQLNYLSSATGTTGTTSTNLVYSTSPTLVTPNLGTPSALVGTNITGTASGLTSGITNALKSATTTVNVSSATAPTSGQVLTATSSTTATWQTSSGIPPQLEYNNTDKTVWCNGKLDYATNTNFGESTITQLSGFAFHNSAFGYTTMYGNTSGSYNTAFGSQSLYSNSTSLYNSAFGQTALYSATGGYNTAVGGSALYSIGAGIRNSGLGFQALNSVVGNYNVALGSNAGQNHSGGSMNLADNSIFIGYNAKAFANNEINQIVIGHDAVGLGSNTTVIGNNSTVNAKIWGALATGSINTGTTLNGTIFAKSANVLSLASTNHALTAGNEASGVNLAIGLYSTSTAIQARSNGASSNIFMNPLGGTLQLGDGALTGQRLFSVINTGSGTGDWSSIEVRNAAASTDAIRMYCLGTGFTTSGTNVQDAGVLTTGTNISGGMSIGTQASADLRFYSNNTLRTTIQAGGNTIHTARVQLSKGANVASAGDLTLGSAGNAFSITGTTTINAITTTSWQAGSVIRLIFASTPTVKNNTAGGASTAKMLLNGGVDFSATANDVLTLIYDGTNWLEVSRSIN